MTGKPIKKPQYPALLFVKEILKQEGLKQLDIAKRSKHPPSYISDLLNGQKPATDDILLDILLACELKFTDAKETIRNWKKNLVLTKKEKFIQNHFIEVIPIENDEEMTTRCVIYINKREKDNNKTYRLNFSIKNNRVNEGKIQFQRWENREQNIIDLDEDSLLKELEIDKETFFDIIISEAKFTLDSQNQLKQRDLILISPKLLSVFVESWEESKEKVKKTNKTQSARETYDMVDGFTMLIKRKLKKTEKNEKYLSEIEKAINLYLGKYE